MVLMKMLGSWRIASFLLALSFAAATPCSGKTFDIGILRDGATPEFDVLLGRLEREVKAVVGQDAEVRFQRGDILADELDLEKALANYNALVQGDTDIILVVGQLNSEVVTRQTEYPKPTILFGTVNQSLLTTVESGQGTQIRNFTYLVAPQSYSADLDALRSLFDFERVGVLVDSSVPDLGPITAYLDSYFQDGTATYELIRYSGLEDLGAQLADVDAVYLAEGFLIPPSERAAIAEILIDRRLPNFTGARREDVENGWMATNRSDANFEQFFRRIALTIEAVVNGKNLGSLPVYLEFADALTVNYPTTVRVGVPVRYATIANTEFVGDSQDRPAERQYNLPEAVRAALEGNLSFRSSQMDVALSEQDLSAAWSEYLPSVTATGTGSHVDPNLARASGGQNAEYSTVGALSLTQVLFSSAANSNIEIQRDLLESQRATLSASEMDLVLDTATGYFDALKSVANIKVQYQNLALTRQNLALAQNNLDAGSAGQADVLRFRSELAQNQQSFIEAIHTHDAAIHNLNLLLSNPIEMEIGIDDVVLEGNGLEGTYGLLAENLDSPTVRGRFVDFLVDEAHRFSPELHSVDYAMQARDAGVARFGARWYLPTVALQGAYNRRFDQWGAGEPLPGTLLEDDYSLRLNLSVPLFDSNARHIGRQTSLIEQSQLRTDRELLAEQIDLRVRSAVLTLHNEVSNIELSKVSEEAAQQSLALTQAAYSTGASTVLELLDAQTNLLQAQLASTTAAYDFLLAGVALERAIGYFPLLRSEAENNGFFNRFQEFESR